LTRAWLAGVPLFAGPLVPSPASERRAPCVIVLLVPPCCCCCLLTAAAPAAPARTTTTLARRAWREGGAWAPLPGVLFAPAAAAAGAGGCRPGWESCCCRCCDAWNASRSGLPDGGMVGGLFYNDARARTTPPVVLARSRAHACFWLVVAPGQPRPRPKRR
jgi:hypothetical protein